MTAYGIMRYVAVSHGHRQTRSSHDEVTMPDACAPASPMNDDGATKAGWGVEQGEALRRLRRARNLRQSELADLIGQPRTVVSNFENGSRTPRPELIARLARVLQVDVTELLSPVGAKGAAIPHEADLQSADRWPTLTVGLQRLVTEEERYRLDRFVAQGDLYGRLSADIPPIAHTWDQLRQLPLDVQHVLGNQNLAANEARSAGRSLALRIRDAFGFARSPLPPLNSLADMLGLMVFTAPLSAGRDGRLRGVLIEHPRFDGHILLNATLDEQHQVHALAQLLGMTLLQPPPAAILAATWTHPQRVTDRLTRTASVAFAREFVLPSSTVADYLAVSAPLAATSTQEQGTLPVQMALLASLARNYSAPAATLVAQLRAINAVSSSEAIEIERQLRPLVHPPVHPRFDSAPSGTWRASPENLSPRFLTTILTAIIDERISVGRASEITGMDQDDLEVLAVASDMERRRVIMPRDESEDGWSDGWDLSAA
jgi:transcriptional regulator with XRE-family HTH domain